MIENSELNVAVWRSQQVFKLYRKLIPHNTCSNCLNLHMNSNQDVKAIAEPCSIEL